jgi:hypothetical protein
MVNCDDVRSTVVYAYYSFISKSWICGSCFCELGFGQLVQDACSVLGWNTATASKNLNVSMTTIRRWQNAEQLPSVEKQKEVMRIFRKHITALMWRQTK